MIKVCTIRARSSETRHFVHSYACRTKWYASRRVPYARYEAWVVRETCSLRRCIALVVPRIVVLTIDLFKRFLSFLASWRTSSPTWYRILHCQEPRNIHAQSAITGRLFFSRRKLGGLKRKWDCITCARISIALTDGQNRRYTIFLYIFLR